MSAKILRGVWDVYFDSGAVIRAATYRTVDEPKDFDQAVRDLKKAGDREIVALMAHLRLLCTPPTVPTAEYCFNVLQEVKESSAAEVYISKGLLTGPGAWLLRLREGCQDSWELPKAGKGVAIGQV